MTSTENSLRFHLRRVGPPATRNESSDLMCFTRPVTFIGRNPDQVDYVISSKNFVQNAIISRRHARVVRSVDSSSFRIHDDSRNGVFVNNVKIAGSVILNEGDCVTFGHPMGEKLQPGTWMRQPDSEYQFVFERCGCSIPLTPSSQGSASPAQSASLFSGEPITSSPVTVGSHPVPVAGEGSFRAPAPLVGRSLSLKRVPRKSVTLAEIESSSHVSDSAISGLCAELRNADIPNNSTGLPASEKHSSGTAVNCSSNANGTVLSVRLSDAVVPDSQEPTVFDSTPSHASNHVQRDGPSAKCSPNAGSVRQISSSDVALEGVISSKESRPGTVVTPSDSNMTLCEMDSISLDSQSGCNVKFESQSVEAISLFLLSEKNAIENQGKANESSACELKVAQAVSRSTSLGFDSVIELHPDEEKENVVKEIERTGHEQASEIKEEMMSVNEESHQKSLEDQVENGDIMRQIDAVDLGSRIISQEITSVDDNGSCALIDEKSMLNVSREIPSPNQHLIIENYAGDRVAVQKTEESSKVLVCNAVAEDVELSYAANDDGGNLFGDEILVEAKETAVETDVERVEMEETADDKWKSSDDIREIRGAIHEEEESGKVCCDELLQHRRNENFIAEDLTVMEMGAQADNSMQAIEEAGKENVRERTELRFTNDSLECTSIYDMSCSELSAWNPDLTITEQVDKVPEQKIMPEEEVRNRSDQIPVHVAESATELTNSEMPVETVTSFEIVDNEVASRDFGVEKSSDSALETGHPSGSTAGNDAATGAPVVMMNLAAETVVSSGSAPREIATDERTLLESIVERDNEIPQKDIVTNVTVETDRNANMVTVCAAGSAEMDLLATTEVTTAEECPTSVTVLTFHAANSVEDDLAAVTEEGNSPEVATGTTESFESASKETVTEGIIKQEISRDIAEMVPTATECANENCITDFILTETGDTDLAAEVAVTFHRGNRDIANEETGRDSGDGEHFVEVGIDEDGEADRSSAAEKESRPETVIETTATDQTAVQETGAEEAVLQNDVVEKEITVFETDDSVGEVVTDSAPTEEAAALTSDVALEEMVTANSIAADTTMRDMADEDGLFTEETITDLLVKTVTNDGYIDDRTPQINTETSTILVDTMACAQAITSENTMKETDEAADGSVFVVAEAKDKCVMMDSHNSVDLVTATCDDLHGGSSTLSATKDYEMALPACCTDSASGTVINIAEMSGLADEEKACSSEPWQRMMTAFIPLHTSTPLDGSDGLGQEKTEGVLDAERADLEMVFSGATDMRKTLEPTKDCHLSEVGSFEDSLKGICSWTEFVLSDSSTLVADVHTKTSGPFTATEVSVSDFEAGQQRQRDDQHPLLCAELPTKGDIVASEECVSEDASQMLTAGEEFQGNVIEDLLETEEHVPENATGEQVCANATAKDVDIEEAVEDSTRELEEIQEEHLGNATESVEMVGNDKCVPEHEVTQLETEDKVPEDVCEPEDVAGMEAATMTQGVDALEAASKQENATMTQDVDALEVASKQENTTVTQDVDALEAASKQENATLTQDAAELKGSTQPCDALEKGAETDEWVEEDATQDMVELSETMTENAVGEEVAESATLKLVKPEGHFLACASEEGVCEVNTDREVLNDASAKETVKQVVPDSAAVDVMETDEQVPEGSRKELETDKEVPEDATQEEFGIDNQLAEDGIRMALETEEPALSNASRINMKVIEQVLEDVITDVVDAAEKLPKADDGEMLPCDPSYGIGEMVIAGEEAVEDVSQGETKTEDQVQGVVCKVLDNDEVAYVITTEESEECLPEEIFRKQIDAEVQQTDETVEALRKSFFDAIELLSMELYESILETTLVQVSEEATGMVLAEISKDATPTEERTVANGGELLEDVVQTEVGISEEQPVETQVKLLMDVVQTGAGLSDERTVVNSSEFSEDAAEAETRAPEEGSKELVEIELDHSRECTVNFSLEQTGIMVEAEVCLPEEVNELKMSEVFPEEVVQSDAKLNDEDIIRVIQNEHQLEEVHDAGTAQVMMQPSEEVPEVQIPEEATEMFSSDVIPDELQEVERVKFVGSGTTRDEDIAIEGKNVDDGIAETTERVGDIVSAEKDLILVQREVVAETLPEPLSLVRAESPKAGSSQIMSFGSSNQQITLEQKESDIFPPSSISVMSYRTSSPIPPVTEQIFKKEHQCRGPAVENNYQKALLPSDKFEDDDNILNQITVEEGQFDDVDSDETDASIRVPKENTSSSSNFSEVACSSPAYPLSILSSIGWMPSSPFLHSPALSRRTPGVLSSPSVQHSPVFSDAKKRKRPVEPDIGWKRSRLEQSAGLGELPSSLSHPVFLQESVIGCGSTSETGLLPTSETVNNASKPEIESNELSSRKLDSNWGSLQLNADGNEPINKPSDDTSVGEQVEKISREVAVLKNSDNSVVDERVHAYVHGDFSLPEKVTPVKSPDLVENVHKTQEMVIRDNVKDVVMVEQTRLEKETRESKFCGLVKEHAVGEITEEVFEEGTMDGARNCEQQLPCSGNTLDELKIATENNEVEKKESGEDLGKELITEDAVKNIDEEMRNADAEMSENCFEGQKTGTGIKQLAIESGELQDEREKEMYTQRNTDHEGLAERRDVEDTTPNACCDEQLVDVAMVETASDVTPLHMVREQHLPDILPLETDVNMSGSIIVAESISEPALAISCMSEEPFGKQNDETSCDGHAIVEWLNAKTSFETGSRSIVTAQGEEKDILGNCFTVVHMDESTESNPLVFDVPVDCRLDSSASYSVAFEREEPFTSTQLPGEDGHDEEWLPPSSPQFSISGTQEDIFADDGGHDMNASSSSPVAVSDLELRASVNLDLQKASNFVISTSLPLTDRSLTGDGVNCDDTDSESLNLYLEMSQGICTQPRASQSDCAAVLKTERVSCSIEMAVVLGSGDPGNVEAVSVDGECHSENENGRRSSAGDDYADELTRGDDQPGDDCTLDVGPQNDEEEIATESKDECCLIDVVQLNEMHLEKERESENSDTGSKHLNDRNVVVSDVELADGNCKVNAVDNETVLLLNSDDVTHMSSPAFQDSNLPAENHKSDCADLEIKDVYSLATRNVLTEEMDSCQDMIATEAQLATEATSQLATEATSQFATEAISQLATEAISHLATEAISQFATEATSQLATEAISHLATEAISQFATEATSQLAIEATSQLATEAISHLATEATSPLAASQTISRRSIALLPACSSRNNAMKNEDNVNDDNALQSVAVTEFVVGTETIDPKTDDDTQDVVGTNDGLMVCKEDICDDDVNRCSLDAGNAAQRDVESIEVKEMLQVEGLLPENDLSKSMRIFAVNSIDLDNFNIICNDSKVAESTSSANETTIACSNFESSERGQAVVASEMQHQDPTEQDLNLEDPADHVIPEDFPVDLDVSSDQQMASEGQQKGDEKNRVELCTPLQCDESFGELDFGTKDGITMQGETLPVVAHGMESVNASLLVRSESPDFDFALPKAISSSSCSDESTNKEEQEEDDEDDEEKDDDDDENIEEGSRSLSPDIFICAPKQQQCADVKSVAKTMDPPAFDDSIDDFTPPTVDLSCIDSDHDEPTVMKLLTAEEDDSSYAAASLHKVVPDSFYVGASSHKVVPDSSHVGASSRKVVPDSSYVEASSHKVVPDSSYVEASSHTVVPDSSYVEASSHTVVPDSSHVGASSHKVVLDSICEQWEFRAKARCSEILSKKRPLSDSDDGLVDSKRLKHQSSPVVFEIEKETFSEFHLPEPRSPFSASSATSGGVSGSSESSANLFSQSLFSQSLFSQDQETYGSQVTNSQSRRRSEVVSGVLQKIKSKLETKTKPIEICGMDARSSSPEPVEPESFVPQVSSDANEINSSVEKSIFQSYSAIVKELKAIFQNDLPGIKSQRVLSWKNEVSSMESVHCLPKTIVAVVGETGAGKSSLLNALLDHADVLPTSGMRACTAVVVQVADNPHSNNYEAEIEFLSEEEWMEELEILLRELTGRSGKVRTQQPDQNSDSIVAWSKIRAVYGKFSNSVTLEQLSQQKTVTRWLGKTKHIIHTSPREFKKEIDRYIESRDVGSGGDYWPIVKLVKTRIPNCGICSSGAILVDMPGMGDSNAARNNIAKQYMQNCNSVWVVSNIHRAVDNKIAKDLLGEHFRRQLLMDGQYSSVSFICTKTDIVNTSETISELHMEGESDVLLNEISDLEERITRRERESMKATQRMNVLNEKINALKRERISLSTDVEELTQVLEDEEEIDDEVSDTLTQLQQTVASKDEILQSTHADLECLRITEVNSQKEVSDCNRLIRRKRQQLRELCAKARNEYSTRQIRRDFRAGIKEVQKKTHQKTGNAASGDEMDSNESDDDDDDDDDGGDGMCRTAENLKVFCVSSTEYLKLTGKLKKDGPAEVFQSIEDTGIPAVVNYAHALTRVRRRQGVERLGKSLGRFVFEVLSYVSDAGTKDHATQEAAEVIFEEHTAELRNRFAQITDKIVQQIGDLFRKQLLPKIDLGVQSAVSTALGTVVKWGTKPNKENRLNKENRANGGLPWSTYKATTSRSGSFRSPAYGPIDFNEDLAGPMYDALTVTWNKIFNCQMCTILDSLKQNTLSALTKFCKDLHLELDRVPVNSAHLARIKQQVITSSENRLSEAIVQIKDFITQRQRDVNRVITPSIQTDMQPAYSYCTSEVGQGQFQRMKTVMSDHIDSTKQTMMKEAASKIVDQLWQLQAEIELRLHDVFELLMQDLSALYEPIWESRNPLLLQRPKFIHDILGLKNQMFSFYEKIDFSRDAPELLIFDKTLAFMTAKIEKSPTLKELPAHKLGYTNYFQSPEQPRISSRKEAATTVFKTEMISPPNSLNFSRSKCSTSSSLPPVKLERPGSCSVSLRHVTASTSHAGKGAPHQAATHTSHTSVSSPELPSSIQFGPVVLKRMVDLTTPPRIAPTPSAIVPTPPAVFPLVIKQEELSPVRLKRKRKSFCSGDVIDLTNDDDGVGDSKERVSLLTKRRRN